MPSTPWISSRASRAGKGAGWTWFSAPAAMVGAPPAIPRSLSGQRSIAWFASNWTRLASLTPSSQKSPAVAATVHRFVVLAWGVTATDQQVARAVLGLFSVWHGLDEDADPGCRHDGGFPWSSA